MARSPDETLMELRDRLAACGVRTTHTSLWRFFRRHGVTRKKATHAAEQDRPDVLSRRRAWFDGQPDLDIPTGWCSSTRPGPRPPWREPTGVRPEASGCALQCLSATGRPRPSWAPCAGLAWSPPWCWTAPSTATPSKPTSSRSSCPTCGRRRGGHGQPLQPPPTTARARPEPGRRRRAPLPPALQSDFNPIEKAFANPGSSPEQGPAAQGRRAKRRRLWPSAALSTSSPPSSATTTSPPAGTMQRDREPL